MNKKEYLKFLAWERSLTFHEEELFHARLEELYLPPVFEIVKPKHVGHKRAFVETMPSDIAEFSYVREILYPYAKAGKVKHRERRRRASKIRYTTSRTLVGVVICDCWEVCDVE